jgi:sugar/nucleoside kinase (ribokinase family)
MLLAVRARSPAAVVVAGHICLDLIPQASVHPRHSAGKSEALDSIGPLTLAVGGCVGNTGIALSRLGLRTSLVARVGDDELGRLLEGLVREAMPSGDIRLLVTPGAATSYSLIASQPGRDRAIRHFAGANETFTAADVPDEVLRASNLLHVGYPPLLAALIEADGSELAVLLGRARRHGLVTSVDMANANLGPGDDRLRWRRVLGRILPETDVFVPSLGEATRLLRRRVRGGTGGMPDLAAIARLADEFVELGAGIAGIKLGEHGLYIRTSSPERLASAGPVAGHGWAGRELYSSVFEADVVGTTGAGDATFAGFLFGLLAGLSPDGAMTAACAVGGSSTEATDGASGVPSWPDIEARIARGWRRRPATPGPRWRRAAEPGLWHGPSDAGPTGGGG